MMSILYIFFEDTIPRYPVFGGLAFRAITVVCKAARADNCLSLFDSTMTVYITASLLYLQAIDLIRHLEEDLAENLKTSLKKLIINSLYRVLVNTFNYVFKPYW